MTGPLAREQAQPVKRPSLLALAATGGALMVHDWKDRSIWFQRGYGSQP